MSALDDRDRERTAYLLAAYEHCDGDTMAELDTSAVGARLEMSQADIRRTVQWLGERGYIADMTFGGIGHLTARAIDEAERLLRAGAAVPLSVVVLSTAELRAVEAFLTSYRRSAEESTTGLDAEELLEAQALVETIEAQARSPRPRRRVIRAALRELHGLLQNVAGSGLYEALQKLIHLL